MRWRFKVGWSLGYDDEWKRDIGYGVPAICDHPYCNNEIDRGISFVCGGEVYGGDVGCGLFFCDEHLGYNEDGKPLCGRCNNPDENGDVTPFEAKEDSIEWIKHKLSHPSWKEWRSKNPELVKKMNG